MAGSVFILIFDAYFSSTHPTSQRGLNFSGAMSTYSSHPDVLLDTGPNSRRRAAIYNHRGYSPILLKTLSSRHLITIPVGVPPLARLSNYLYRSLAAGFSRLSKTRRTLLVTFRRPANHYPGVNSALSLFITNFTVDFWTFPSSPKSGATFSLERLYTRRLWSYFSFNAALTPTFYVSHP